jgi:hypothetical protein
MMTADKTALGRKTSRSRDRAADTVEPNLIRRALLRTAVYTALIALSILIWWGIARLFLGG